MSFPILLLADDDQRLETYKTLPTEFHLVSRVPRDYLLVAEVHSHKAVIYVGPDSPLEKSIADTEISGEIILRHAAYDEASRFLRTELIYKFDDEMSRMVFLLKYGNGLGL